MVKVMPDKVKVRLDKWLWAARFYRTRSLASAAVRGGKVHLNGNRVKPSQPLACNAEVAIHRGADKMTVIVKAVSAQRSCAESARLLYQETPQSLACRAAAQEQQALVRQLVQYARGKPSKAERRQARRLRRDPFGHEE